MRCVSIATCTSGDPVSPGCVAYSSMIAFLTSASSAIDSIPSLLVARCPAPDVRALFIRGRSNGNLKSLPAESPTGDQASPVSDTLETCTTEQRSEHDTQSLHRSDAPETESGVRPHVDPVYAPPP